MEPYLIKTKKVSKSYNDIKILTDIDFALSKGDYLAVMGPSGAGKSTFMNIISGMDKPTSGKVYIEDQELVNMKSKEMANLRLKKIGMVFQKPSLLPTLNLIDNIMLPGFMLKDEPINVIYKRARELLSLFGIANKETVPINTLSGGQLQRGCIARALINKPSIIFADEPTGALNSAATQDVLNVLEIVNNRGTAIIVVTHDVVVSARSKKVIYLFDGVIKEQIYFDLDETQDNRKNRIVDLIDKY